MPTSKLKLVHVSPRVQARGGVEALHRHHRKWNVRQHFVALFDREPEPAADYTNVNATWRMPLWKLRRAFARAMTPHAGGVVIYHHLWGLPLFHDVDGAERRIVNCLGMPSYHEAELRASRGLVDGAMGITPSLEPCWRETLPELREGRCAILPMPVEAPAAVGRGRCESGGEMVIGYAGRLERRHKRVDRLPEFLRELKARGRRFRFEVLGDGVWRERLERETGNAVTFHGWTSKEEFWRVMSGWDAVVFFSEMEGGPLALLEGCAVGAIPFFPAIGGSLGDLCAPKVDARCHYPAGDMRALAKAVDDVLGQTVEGIAAARDRARNAVAGYGVGEYERAFLAFAEEMRALPRISKRRRRRSRILDALPLGLATRLTPWALRAS